MIIMLFYLLSLNYSVPLKFRTYCSKILTTSNIKTFFLLSNIQQNLKKQYTNNILLKNMKISIN